MSDDHVEDFLEFQEKEAQVRAQRDLQYWQQWKEGGKRPEHLEPLLKVYQPRFNQKVQQWKPPAIPEAAFRAELHRNFIQALETYNPNKGASVSTHVENRLQKTKRFVGKHQNIGYIPEGQARYIGTIQRAQDELTEEFGRAPSDAEIGRHIGLPIKRVKTIRAAMVRDIPSSMFESDPTARASRREQEVLSLLPTALKPDELEVFNHVYGREGRSKITSTNALAARLGKSPSQISRIKTRIARKYKQFS